MSLNDLPRINILGVAIHAITLSQSLEQISTWIQTQSRRYVSVCTVHTVMECQKSQKMRQAVNGADLATPDGMPLVWLGKWWSDAKVGRGYGPDLMLALCELSAAYGYSHYFYGGTADVPERLAGRLKTQFPELKIAGSYSPPFRPLTTVENQQIIDQINRNATARFTLEHSLYSFLSATLMFSGTGR